MRKVVVAALVVALALMVGCANVKLKDPTEMTPQEKATFVMKLWSKAANNVLEMEKMPLNPQQKEMLDKQKTFLKQSSIVIDAYVGYIDGGMKPSAEMENQINGLIDKFLLGQ